MVHSKQQDLSLMLQHFIQELRPFLEMQINEIIFNGPYVLYLVKGSQTQRVENARFDERFLLNFCEQLATYRHQRFDLNHPKLSTSIPFTQYRVNAIHPSVTANHTIAINIRIPHAFKFPIDAFQLGKKCLERQINYADFTNLVKQGKNILVSGGTASGKTSFVNCLIESIPSHERVISIEDSPELKISNENKVSIIVGKNEDTHYTYEDALNSAMRMSPDRLLLGEIDTRNVALFLRLANTGHSGMISTLHANSVEDAFLAIGMNIKIGSGKDISMEALLDFFIAGIDVIIQIIRKDHLRVIEDVLDVKKDLRKLMVRTHAS
ncbi:ATPase, T2SS/T4P/T4SS family [Helicobacter suis]|uniref:(VirB11-like) Type IV secretion system ATPase n=1 Tax=Helicobacter suis TaxID=104628 RepID=A0ABM7L250_9HELI|nr:ATPase, T2SS/T4P/T4SS family [Helicobacter suis]BCD46776.1 (VirB11-like) Type IV secretion system ATPase [Helicobacter suis]BDR29109.1 conjugal transfer protein TrbB [Helicobacter suis HS1]BDR29141.1 conjugal transfer protein TrbB [Helicobacter suis HS1]GFK17132.1 (VirB11-like) Type IV secretion system ATPase [Helicobacter suis]